MTRCVVGCSSIARGIKRKTNVHQRPRLSRFLPAFPHNGLSSIYSVWGDAFLKHSQSNYSMFVTVVKKAKHEVGRTPKAEGPDPLFYLAFSVFPMTVLGTAENTIPLW